MLLIVDDIGRLGRIYHHSDNRLQLGSWLPVFAGPLGEDAAKGISGIEIGRVFRALSGPGGNRLVSVKPTASFLFG